MVRWRRWVALLLIAVAAVVACSPFGGTDAPAPGDAATGDAAATCVPPTCGGPSGRCGSVDACGLTFSCGDCAAPFACVNGTCTCAAPAKCDTLGAACGTFSDGCGNTLECGGCDAGGSCQSTTDAGYACSSAPCIPNDTATTCKGHCQTVPNNCAKAVNCGVSCGGSQICGVGAPTSCGCPPRTLGLFAFHATSGNGFHCYGTITAQCPNDPVDGQVGTMHNQAYGSLVPLSRCHGANDSFLLATTSNCNGVAGYTYEGVIGFCSPTPTCNSFPLVAYISGGGDLIYLPAGSVVNGYTAVGTVCNIWP